MRHYLGESDKASVRRQIERCRQGDSERAAVFIPRILRLFSMVEPDKPEEELVEAIRPKLRKDYQDRLAMHDIYTVERLNDLCLKVETNVESVRKSNAKGSRKPQDNQNASGKSQDSKGASSEAEPSKDGLGGQSRRSRCNRSDLVCLRCDRPGHVRPRCCEACVSGLLFGPQSR
jgi:hypothetical protein